MSRHFSTEQLMRWFSYDHLPEGLSRDISAICQDLAKTLLNNLSDGPELSAGLRKLLEAKDCFVRQAISDNNH